MTYDHNLDDYAWYEVGNQRYYNKIEALFAHQCSRQPLRWNVTDFEYSQHKWDIEPQLDLETLYARRAQDIRERYDYLVLHFSGGSDSANVIETFIRNKIHLDEVLIRGSMSQADQKTGVLTAIDQYGECMTQSLPLANWIKANHMPHLRITVVDTVSMINDFYRNNPDWIEQSVTGLTPSNYVKSNLDILAPHYKQLADQGKRVAHIFGVDKPKIFRHKNYFYTKFLDVHLGEWASVRFNTSVHPQYIELFYWGKRAIELQIKQLHKIKQHIKANAIPDFVFDHTRGRAFENYIASVVYNRTLPLLSEHLKDDTKLLVAGRDLWFTKDLNSDSFNNWKKGADYLRVLIDPVWHHSDGFWQSGINGIWSKPYYLGT